MTFNTPPAPFLPPAPPRKSRAGGIILLLAGALAAASPFIAWVPAAGQGKSSLKYFADQVAQFKGDLPFLDNFQNWFYAILGGAAIAIIFGLIGLAGSKGVNVTVGIFALLAAVAISYPPIWLLTSAGSAESLAKGLSALGAGYYAAAAAGFLALVAMLFAFIGAARK